MSRNLGLLKSTFLATLVFVGTAGIVRAADPNDVANRLKAALQDQGVTISWGGVSGNDASMVISHVTAMVTGQPKQFEIGDITMTGITDANGGYRVASVTVPDYTISEPHSSFDMSGIKLSGLHLPAPGGNDPLGGLIYYENAQVKSASIKADGKQLFILDNLHMDLTPPDGDKVLDFKGGADSFSADLSTVKDPKTQTIINALGYQNINGTIGIQGSWSPKDGKAILDKYQLAVKNAGTLDIGLGISGYTRDFIKSLREVRQQMAAAPKKNKSAEGLVMLGLIQQLSFLNANISYTDDSLVGKVMDFVAAQEHMQRKDIVNQAKAVLPFALAKLKNPEFSAKISDAVSKFLDDPKSLTITATPPAPLSFSVIMAGAMAAPQQLPNQLGVTVTANK